MIINSMVNIDARSDRNCVSSASAPTPTGFTVSEEDRRHLTEDGVASRNTERRSLTSISLLQEVRRSGISAVNRPDEWIAIDVTVDFGACVTCTVMPPGLCPGIQIIQNDLSQNGIQYEVANGESIDHLGEKRCQVMTIGSMLRHGLRLLLGQRRREPA